MSINNIISSTNPNEVNPRYGYISGSFKNLTIDERLIIKEDDQNRVGYTLQCYDSGFGAKFLPPPIFNNLDQDIYIITPDVEDNVVSKDLSFEDEDNEDNFEKISDTEIQCINTGLYWVTTKVCKLDSTVHLQTQLFIDDEPILESYSATPYNPGANNFVCNFASFLLRIDVGEIVTLNRIFGPAEGTFSMSDGEHSFISFIRINANL